MSAFKPKRVTGAELVEQLSAATAHLPPNSPPLPAVKPLNYTPKATSVQTPMAYSCIRRADDAELRP